MNEFVRGGRGGGGGAGGTDAAGPEPGQVLRWNLFIGGHLSSSVPVRLVERTDEGQWVWLESGTPMWRTKLPRRTHLRDITPETRPPHGYPARAGRWPAAAPSSTSRPEPPTRSSGSSHADDSSGAGT